MLWRLTSWYMALPIPRFLTLALLFLEHRTWSALQILTHLKWSYLQWEHQTWWIREPVRNPWSGGPVKRPRFSSSYTVNCTMLHSSRSLDHHIWIITWQQKCSLLFLWDAVFNVETFSDVHSFIICHTLFCRKAIYLVRCHGSAVSIRLTFSDVHSFIICHTLFCRKGYIPS